MGYRTSTTLANPKMTVNRLSLFIFLFFLQALSAMVPILEVQVDPAKEGIDHRSVSVTVTITHGSEDRIDPQTFELSNKSVQADLVKRLTIGHEDSSTVLSLYRFELPSVEPGKHTLGPISVKINGEKYSSDSFDYNVKGPSMINSDDKDIVFKLEATLEGPETLYPGQRARVVYRIYFNRNIDITSSEFPLLYSSDFRRIGDKAVIEAQNEGFTAQEISQEIETIKPGKFQFGSSSVDGYVYELNNKGEKVFQDRKIHAEAPPLEIVVAPFPEQNQPLSFSGAIGKLKIEEELLTPSEMEVGDKLKLKITVFNDHDLDELKIPPLSCQPGISGFFTIDTIEPGGAGQGYKSFIIVMRPQTELATTIPSLEMASFDPTTRQYLKRKTSPLAIQVTEPLATLPAAHASSSLDEATLLFLDKKFKSLPTGELDFQEPLLAFKEGDESYQRGLNATTLWERQVAFNQALDDYKKRELERGQSEALWLAIGETYYQLGEYARAMAYYYKALQRDPHNARLKSHLKLAQKHLQMPSEINGSILGRVLSLDGWLSAQRRYQIFMFFLIAYLISAWLDKKIKKILGLIAVVFLLNLGIQNFLIPDFGIIVDPIKLYSQPTNEQVYQLPYSLEAGKQVRILDVQKGSKWIKIKSDNVVGFIFSDSIIII